MSSRETILASIKGNQPEQHVLPDIEGFRNTSPGDPVAFCKVVETLGGEVIEIARYSDIPSYVQANFTDQARVVAVDSAFYPGGMTEWKEGDGRQLEQVDLAIVPGQLGVAENGAVWVTEKELVVRVLPFITQHLAIVLSAATIVPTMHDAYNHIGGPETGFGVFIAGPSKTADIEQSLVLGAHGAKSLTIFLMP
ncbi:L-lactate dehydrogenase complex protein LldG [Chitinophaga sp. CF118]|uniref:LutC/YkgG family protein n=1 Tax=Chitinophaga sp. CF118 TaxID=1884367 RepID=UPI0008EEBD2A|nr:LUD domain-containing protein [Chitinophaga sp. CF118]SFD79811.1 L-lactate dehydrogenase complex protein LldG [Chitinophaga sp. CF118]